MRWGWMDGCPTLVANPPPVRQKMARLEIIIDELVKARGKLGLKTAQVTKLSNF